MADDVMLNKAAIIERCLRRIDEDYRGHEKELGTNYTRQDAIILNLQRACEASIDMAMHSVHVHGLGLPQQSRDAFQLLQDAGFIPADLCTKMKSMVGFRNIAVHDYRQLNLDIIRAILTNHLQDFQQFSTTMLQATP